MIYKDKGLMYSNYIYEQLLYRLGSDSDLRIKVETFYNCRELGYVFRVNNSDYNDTLYIWVYAHRNSDEPTIIWGKEIEFNNMFTEEDWNNNQKTFENVDKAVDFVCELLDKKIEHKEC